MSALLRLCPVAQLFYFSVKKIFSIIAMNRICYTVHNEFFFKLIILFEFCTCFIEFHLPILILEC